MGSLTFFTRSRYRASESFFTYFGIVVALVVIGNVPHF